MATNDPSSTTRVFPVLDPAPLSTPISGKGQVPRGSYVPTPQVIHYYTFSKLDQASRGVFLSLYSGDASALGQDMDQIATWIFSLYDCMFPQNLMNLMSKCSTARFSGVECTPDIIDQLENGSTAGMIYLPDYEPNFERLQEASWSTAVAACSVIFYAIGKRADSANISAFTVNRPRALLGKLGIAQDEAGILSADSMPSLLTYNMVSGFFNTHKEVRRVFLEELVSWIWTPNISKDQELIVTSIKLWENSGLTHVRLIQQLLESYAGAVARVPLLAREALAFIGEYRAVSSKDIAYMSYTRVLLGDSSRVLSSRNYPELLKIAREVAIVLDSRFQQYAPQLGKSGLLGEFRKACSDAGYDCPLPTSTD